MKRNDGAWMTGGEMAETIHRLRLELDERDDKIAKLNHRIELFERQFSEVVLPSRLPDEREEALRDEVLTWPWRNLDCQCQTCKNLAGVAYVTQARE